MKKSVLTLWLAAACACTCVGVAASAEGGIAIEASDLSVVLPSDYEQYLPLSAPKAVAINDAFLSVSDGNLIYVYDKARGQYRAYTHTVNTDNRLNTISNLEFGIDGLLYFTDSSTALYLLDCSQMEPYPTQLSCSAFALAGDTLYYATVTSGLVSISAVNTSVITSGEAVAPDARLIDQVNSTATPAMAIGGGVLYYAIGNDLHSTQNELVLSLPAGGNIQSLGFVNGDPYYTDSVGNFYHYSLPTQEILERYASSYSFFGKYGDSFYLVNGRSVLLYDAEAAAFTDFEICSASSGKGRLNQATDLVLYEDKLVIADRGNKRFSVCDLATKRATPYPCSIEPDLIAVTEGKVLVSNGTAAAIYDLQGNEQYIYSSFSGVIMGAEGVYGNFYLVTGNNYHYRLAADIAPGTAPEETYKTLDNTAKQLSSDIDGNLYILYTNGSVSRYAESEYMSATGGSRTICRFPTTVTQIFTDFSGNVYAMYGNTLYYAKDERSIESYEFRPDGSVYGTGYTATSYAISYESPILYALCGDFIVSTEAIPFRTLNDISVEDADREIFDLSTSAEAEFLRTAKRTLFIRISLSDLQNAAYFTYDSHVRQAEEQIAAKIGETSDYYIVSLFDADRRDYTLNLVKKDYCTPIPPEEYRAEGAEFADGIGFASNAVRLYKYPFLAEQLTMESRGTPIVIGKSNALRILEILDFGDETFGFYRVEYSAGGQLFGGYLPIGYLRPYDGATPAETTMTLLTFTPRNQIVLTSAADQTKTISAKTQVEVYGNLDKDESVVLCLRENGIVYTVTVSPSLFSSGISGNWLAFVICLPIFAIVMVLFDVILLRRMKE